MFGHVKDNDGVEFSFVNNCPRDFDPIIYVADSCKLRENQWNTNILAVPCIFYNQGL